MRYLHPQKTNASTINLRPRKKICVAQVTQPTLILKNSLKKDFNISKVFKKVWVGPKILGSVG